MTNQEAIRNLDTMWKMLTSAYDDIADSYVVAYTMAVDALKAQIDKDTNVPSKDTISRQAAIDAIEHYLKHPPKNYSELFVQGMGDAYYRALSILRTLPSAQPVLDRTKISDLLEKIYSIQSPHLSTEGVIAKKYYCEQLWIELFGSEDVPTWMI